MWTRREIVRGGLPAVALGLGCKGRRAPVGEAGAAPRPDRQPDVEVTLHAQPGEVALEPGATPTRVWRYEGKLVKGPAEALTSSPDSYLGPTFRVRPGQRVRVRFENGLREDSIVH